MYYRDQIEKIMSEAGFSDSERDERLKVLLSKIEKHGLFEELKNLLSRKIDTSPKDPITGDEFSLVH